MNKYQQARDQVRLMAVAIDSHTGRDNEDKMTHQIYAIIDEAETNAARVIELEAQISELQNNRSMSEQIVAQFARDRRN